MIKMSRRVRTPEGEWETKLFWFDPETGAETLYEQAATESASTPVKKQSCGSCRTMQKGV